MMRFTILLLSWLGFGSVALAQENVALVFTVPGNELSVSGLEFFRSVRDIVVTQRYFELYSDREVQTKLDEKAPLKTAISGLSYFERSLWQNTFNSKTNKINESLQYMLDSLALDGAIVVDCTPGPGQTVKGCGLYYYDRSRSSVHASAEKAFQIPIKDATKWAAPLVQSLKEGMVAATKAKEKEQVDKFIAKQEEDTSKTKFSLQLGAAGIGFRSAKTRIKNHAYFSLTPSLAGDNTSTGLELSYGKTTKSTASGSNEVLESKSLGLAFHVSSKALDILIWDMGFVGGIMERTVRMGSLGKISAQQPFLEVRPGMYFDLGKNYFLGMDLRLGSYFGGQVKSSGEYAGDGLPATSFGTGLNFVKVFP